MKKSSPITTMRVISVALFVMMIMHFASLIIFAAGGVTQRVYGEICFVGMSFFYWYGLKGKDPYAKPTRRQWIFFAIGCVLFIAGEIIAH